MSIQMIAECPYRLLLLLKCTMIITNRQKITLKLNKIWHNELRRKAVMIKFFVEIKAIVD